MRVLVAEDDSALRAVLERGLRHYGFVVDSTDRGDHALHFLATTDYSAAILDWRMPGLEGPAVVRQARDQRVRTPILMLTARDTAADRVDGLDAGADDYLIKPFDFAELLARIRALLRRPPEVVSPVLRCASLELDAAARTVFVGSSEIRPTRREYALLELLLGRSPAIVTRDSLVSHVWDEAEAISWNALEAHIARLRAKVSPAGVQIVAVRGVGYRLLPG